MSVQEVLLPTPPKLSDYQRVIYEHLQAEGQLTKTEAGTIYHRAKGCRFCDAGNCFYLDGDGKRVLEALKRKGLAERKLPTFDGLRQEVYVLPGSKPRRSGEPREQLPSGMSEEIPF